MNLISDDLLRYKFLSRFDKAMNETEEKYDWLAAPQVSTTSHYMSNASRRGFITWLSLQIEEAFYETLSNNLFQAYVSCKHEDDKVIVFERAGVLFVFNFHCNKSFADYKIGVDIPGTYRVVLDSDEEWFGGHNRVDRSVKYMTRGEPWSNRRDSMMVIITSQ